MIRQIAAAAMLISAAAAFPTGAPSEACTTRTPNHGFAAQTSTCPYDIVALGWIAGEYTSMGIFPTEENSPLQFEGFLASVYYQGNPIGQMKPGRSSDNIPTSAAVKTACRRTSLTHANNEVKSEIFFEWKAPVDLPDDAVVELRLTVVEELDRFWVDCNKILLRSLAANPVETTTTPFSTSTSSSTSSSSSSTTSAAPTPVRVAGSNRPALTPTPAPTPARTPSPTPARTPAPVRPQASPSSPATSSSTSSSSSSSSSSSTSSTTTAAPTPKPTTTRRPNTRPSTTARQPTTTRRPNTRPRTTARQPATTRRPNTRPSTTARQPTTTRRPNTRPKTTTGRPTTRRPNTRPRTTTGRPTTRRPNTRPRTTTGRPTTRRPNTRPRTTTRRPTTRRPNTRPRTTARQPTTTRRPNTRPKTTTGRPATTRRPNTIPQGNSGGYPDSYLDYHNKASLKHETMSDKECVEYGNAYEIIPNTDCRQFTQSIYGGRPSTRAIKCPGATKFDPRVCSCAFTYRCNV